MSLLRSSSIRRTRKNLITLKHLSRKQKARSLLSDVRKQEDFVKGSLLESTRRAMINWRTVRKRVISRFEMTEIIERWTKVAVDEIRCRKFTSCGRHDRDAWRNKEART